MARYHSLLIPAAGLAAIIGLPSKAEGQFACDLNGVVRPAPTGTDSVRCGSFLVTSEPADNLTTLGVWQSYSGHNVTMIGSNVIVSQDGFGLFSSSSYAPPSVLGATAVGAYSIALGTGNVAVGDQSIVGLVNLTSGFLFVGVVANGTAVGSNSLVTADNGTAVGQSASATAVSSTAIGQNADATAANSVALGAGSVADQANTVSVGAVGAERRIVNVAAGIAPTDAVNVSQLGAVTTNVTTLQTAITAVQTVNTTQTTQINTLTTGLATTNTALTNETSARLTGDALLGDRLDDLSFDLRRNGREARAGTSAALAAAALPQAMDPGRSMVSAGVGTYRGRAALAIGGSHRLSGGNAVMKVGITYDTTEHVGANAGVGFQF